MLLTKITETTLFLFYDALINAQMPAEGRGSLAFRLIREYSSYLNGELSRYNPPSFICNSFSSVVFCGCFKRFMVLS